MHHKIREHLDKFELWLSFFLNNRKYRSLFFVLLFLISSTLVIVRKPDTITNPQFYAEDGTLWYSEAYNNGPIKPFLVPKQGYFHTFPRLGAATSLSFDLRYAPLVLNSIAIIIQILPILFLLSSRFDKIIPSYTFRLFLCLSYLFLPHSGETHANLTNSMWRLAILMFLIMIAEFPKNIPWKIFDYFVLLIAGLSGPFSILILPVFLVYEYFSKKRKYTHLAIVFCTACVQLISCFFTLSAQRSQALSGVSIINFFKIIAGNVFICGLTGSNVYSFIRHLSWWNNGLLPIFVGVIGFALIIYVLRQCPLELRLFILFALIIFTAAIITPQVSAEKPQWGVMTTDHGDRYYLLPSLAWVATLLWIFVKGSNKKLKIFSGILIGLLLFVGMPKDYRFVPFQDFRFTEQLKEFEMLPIGSRYDFKIYPEGWKMRLIKK